MSVPKIQARLEAARGNMMSDEQLAAEAVALTGELLAAGRKRLKIRDRLAARKLGRMLDDPSGKALTLSLADQVFRSEFPRRVASQFRYLVKSYGTPSYLPFHERLGMSVGAFASIFFPGKVMPLVAGKMRSESKLVILKAEAEPFAKHARRREEQGAQLNINQLGEAILGEEEAARRLDAVVGRLKDPLVSYVSVKLSAIDSQINLMAFDESLAEVKERLRKLYRTAIKFPYTRGEGKAGAKFVNLDMEEYRDLHLTLTAFKEVLSEPEFEDYHAGIVLQAYLPDSFQIQKELTAWAIERIESGGKPIKLRLVKGANLAMEAVDASQHGWEPAPYGSKAEVDANYKRMVEYGCRPEHARAVRIGIASHNLFDVSHGLLLREMYEVNASVDFEMLEGMANHQAQVIEDLTSSLLFYAPVVCEENFHSAIAYLIRRLDENTTEGNFLRDMFSLKVGSPAWDRQRAAFEQAVKDKSTVSAEPRRKQDRSAEDKPLRAKGGTRFENAPDTDFTLPINRVWLGDLLRRWKGRSVADVPLQIGGKLVDDKFPGEGHDPSKPGKVAYKYALADRQQVGEALACAEKAFETWNAKAPDARAKILLQAAHEMGAAREESIACMIRDGGKAVAEADGEISEAIDFANYYASCLETSGLEGAVPSGRGIVVVVPPWNFPYAIPASGILAGLMAGNAVILKPAPEAVLTGWILAQHLWRAGVPREVLQFVPCPDNEIGQSLVSDPRVSVVVLTGAHSTGKMFQGWRPQMRLFAETSGKNSLIITAAADQDLAVKDLVRSAFGHAGQKCSAASLAILEGEIYDSPSFRRQLRDAAASLKVGSAWEPKNLITPVILEPQGALRQALKTLDEGEEWLLEPRMIDGNPRLWSPGIKLGVVRDSTFHRAECFGPVLGLMRAKNLAEAIELQNDSEFALTGGIHTLDQREIDLWRESAQVGNAYINRPITGAIVRRQPFGGWKHSAFGPGAKAGGPNYVFNFGKWETESLPELRESPNQLTNSLLTQFKRLVIEAKSRELLQVSVWSYGWALHHEFHAEHDPSQLVGETNVFRYFPRERVLLRCNEEAELLDAMLAVLASTTCEIDLEVSLASKHAQVFGTALEGVARVNVVEESEDALLARMKSLESRPGLVRYLGGVPREVYEMANDWHVPVVDDPVSAVGRLELRYYFREQSVSETVHRYGNMIDPPEG
ncbi:MAG: RHH-type proline utilization regulon transcriptional repressor/proline dehydrogenase [Pseudoalteromonas tetraodonis]|jgi:RHH-type proline utilization regulon transcriptional repressor/proline dehydrogenase/delta 1-pyrroline-5-carboxylate dehydrogenase